jgi:sensor domain CHASE-containing protein
VLLTATLILGHWVWQYLTKRIQSQLFMILVAQTVAIFLISTISFTFLLLSRTQSQSLADLNTASHVLDYAIKSRQAETAAQADAVSSRPLIVTAMAGRDHKYLTTALADYMSKHGLTSLVITDASAAVLLRGEDPERWGDSRSSDILIRRALVGESATSVVVRDGVVAPSVMIMAATPARDAAGNIVGVVMTGRAISNAFVDGIKSSTGLDSAVYGGNVRAATTLVNSSGTNRAVGIKEASTAVNERVLKQGKDFSGELLLQNRPYLVAYAPLKDANNVPVGMLLVARPLDALFATATSSIEFTFLLVVIMLAVSVVPVYYISRYISRQLH